jgi:flagellin
MSRLDYASRMLEENQVNLEAARARIMDADMAKEAARMAQQNVLMQAGAAMVSQANQMNSIVLQLLQ